MARHARLMTEAGHRVCIVAGRGQQTDERIPFVPVPEVDSRNEEVLALKGILDLGRVPADFESFVQMLEDRLSAIVIGADRLIAHNVCSLNKNLALTAALHRIGEGGNTKLILWHHDLAWTTPRYRGELHDGYPWDLLRTDWSFAEQVVVSQQRQTELAELLAVPIERVNVIPNGVDVREFNKLEPESERLVKSLRLTTAAPLILLPVRITPRKNIEMAIQVLGVLRRDFPAAILLVTGPLGPHNPANQQYYERLLALRDSLNLKDAVHFLAELVDHTVSDAVVADLYRLADILLLPSREEGFGIPLLEAGLAGVPVFCADIPALRELGGDQVEYFQPEGRPEDVAGHVARVLKTNSVYQLRKRVMREYEWKAVYDVKIAPLLSKG